MTDPKKTPNGPLLLPQSVAFFIATGMRLWTRLLGPKHAKAVVFVGMGISALVAVVLQLTT